MILSKKYTEAMDKIVASDELKAKILRTAAQKRQNGCRRHFAAVLY